MLLENLETPLIKKKKNQKNNWKYSGQDWCINYSIFFFFFLILNILNLCLHEMLLLNINCSFKASVYE